jgi:DNA adenine methylase
MGRVAAHKAPFPYFGGKAAVSADVWARLGPVGRYVEPFAGSLAVMLTRPLPFVGREIVNDSDGLLVNVWRAMRSDPGAVAEWADWPATESDMHARHAWLVGQRETLTASLEGDPDWFDAKAAGWWLWGIGLWIGGGWCSGRGPWRVVEVDSNDGRGIHRQLLHAGDGRGIHRKRPGGTTGNGTFHGVHALSRHAGGLMAVFEPLAERLRDTMIMAGDWARVVTPAVLQSGGNGVTGVFLDPPYADTAGRTADLYAKDSESVAHAVREWAIANGDDPRLRIALCGYDGEHVMPASWSELAWKAAGGYEGQAKGGRTGNSKRERIWFSPHCLRPGLWEATA